MVGRTGLIEKSLKFKQRSKDLSAVLFFIPSSGRNEGTDWPAGCYLCFYLPTEKNSDKRLCCVSATVTRRPLNGPVLPKYSKHHPFPSRVEMGITEGDCNRTWSVCMYTARACLSQTVGRGFSASLAPLGLLSSLPRAVHLPIILFTRHHVSPSLRVLTSDHFRLPWPLGTARGAT